MALQATETALERAAGPELASVAVQAPRKPVKGRASTLAMSREVLEAEGYHVEVVERNERTRHRTWKVDLWGFADILAIRRGEVLAVQTTTSSNMAARVRKIADSPLLPKVREANVRVIVHGWAARVVKRGERARKWVLRVEDVS
jgi:hypothetical protein